MIAIRGTTSVAHRTWTSSLRDGKWRPAASVEAAHDRLKELTALHFALPSKPDSDKCELAYRNIVQREAETYETLKVATVREKQSRMKANQVTTDTETRGKGDRDRS